MSDAVRRVADNAPLTVRACRRLVYMASEMDRPAAMKAADAIFEPVYPSEDAQEGSRAFAEKRKPDWTGR